MSDADFTANEQPERRVIGRPFQPGVSGNPAGRPKGARSKLSEAFIEDLRGAWETHGVKALEECATKEPSQFVRVIASLMPKDINLSVDINPGDFLSKFRSACELLGNAEPPKPPKPRRPLKIIDHEPVRR